MKESIENTEFKTSALEMSVPNHTDKITIAGPSIMSFTPENDLSFLRGAGSFFTNKGGIELYRVPAKNFLKVIFFINVSTVNLY